MAGSGEGYLLTVVRGIDGCLQRAAPITFQVRSRSGSTPSLNDIEVMETSLFRERVFLDVVSHLFWQSCGSHIATALVYRASNACRQLLRRVVISSPGVGMQFTIVYETFCAAPPMCQARY